MRAIVDTVVENFPQIGMNFFTNGVLLNRKNLLSSLVNHGVRWINVSMNAASRETWAQLHGADQFDRVSRNLLELLQEKRACRSIHPIVCGSMVLTRLNIDELPKMPGHCRELGIDRFTAFPFFGFGYGGQGKIWTRRSLPLRKRTLRTCLPGDINRRREVSGFFGAPAARRFEDRCFRKRRKAFARLCRNRGQRNETGQAAQRAEVHIAAWRSLFLSVEASRHREH